MNRSYQKGYAAEREMAHKLHGMGYMVIRAPRSGRMGIALPDILAAKNGKLIVIECKSRDGAFTVEKDQLAQLAEWQDKAGAAAYVGWKIARKGWTFLRLADVAANNGNVGKGFAEKNGITIDEL